LQEISTDFDKIQKKIGIFYGSLDAKDDLYREKRDLFKVIRINQGLENSNENSCSLLDEKEQTMTYNGITLRKNDKCSTWYARIRKHGLQQYISGKTQKECLSNLKKALRVIKKDNVVVVKEKKTSNGYTLKTWCDKWLKTYKENKVRASTFKAIQYLIKNHFTTPLFDKPINDIIQIEIEEFLNGLQYNRVKENSYIYLKDMLSKAVSNRIIPINPMQDLSKPTHEVEEKRALTIDEQSKFETYCLSNPRYYMLLVALWQGLRVGELRALEIQDFNFDDNTLSINKSKNDISKDNRTKNKHSNRTMPLFKKTKAIVQEYWELNNKLFNHTKDYISKILNEVLSALKIKNITMHSLRHTFVTRCQEKKIALYVIQSWVGHAKGSSVTTKTYTHKQDDIEFDSINKYENENGEE